ncbi:MAG: 30S ribosome-binding factor RbfA [Desulfovibrionales bacterium]
MRRSQSQRSKRIADLILREIGTILTEEVQDPRLDLVSISGVRMNKDLSIAEVLYTHSGDEAKREQVQKALDAARGYIRTLLGKRLNMRRTPELRFVWDEFLEVMVYDRSQGSGRPDDQGE